MTANTVYCASIARTVKTKQITKTSLGLNPAPHPNNLQVLSFPFFSVSVSVLVNRNNTGRGPPSPVALTAYTAVPGHS